MNDCVMNKIRKVETTFAGTEFEPYLQAFKLDNQLRNLTDKSLECYFERLACLFSHLQRAGVSFGSVNRQTIQTYIMSLKGQVSDETINGRIRAYKRFWNFLCEEKLWDSDNPMTGIKLLKTAKRVKPVVEPETVQRLMKSMDRSTFEGNRNLIMILLLWDGMLRKNELLGLKIADIQLDNRLIKVFGKGRKERMEFRSVSRPLKPCISF